MADLILLWSVFFFLFIYLFIYFFWWHSTWPKMRIIRICLVPRAGVGNLWHACQTWHAECLPMARHVIRRSKEKNPNKILRERERERERECVLCIIIFIFMVYLLYGLKCSLFYCLQMHMNTRDLFPLLL